MTATERFGIHPRWAKSWMREQASRIKWRDMYAPQVLRELTFYIQNGRALGTEELSEGGAIKGWERDGVYLYNSLAMQAGFYLLDIERRGMSGQPIDPNLLVRAFAASLTSETLGIGLNCKRPPRSTNWLGSRGHPFATLGVILGFEEGFRLARLQILSHRRGYYFGASYYPVYYFMMRILADYLREPPLVLDGELLRNKTLDELFDHWRSPNSEKLAPLCLEACDLHTHRCGLSKESERDEFDAAQFTHFPVEILLLFKLRQLLGLDNPVVDHPLMNSSLGVLPEAVGFDTIAEGPDDLVYRVRERLRADGYDEQRILDDCLCAKSWG